MCTCATQTNDARRARRATLGTCSGWCRKTPFLFFVSAGAAAIVVGPLRAAARGRATGALHAVVARAPASCCCGTRAGKRRAARRRRRRRRAGAGRPRREPRAPSSSSRTRRISQFRATYVEQVAEISARARTSGLGRRARARARRRRGARGRGRARRRGRARGRGVRRARPRRRGAARRVPAATPRSPRCEPFSTCCGESTRARGGAAESE